jgi:hypothetical protein
MALVGIYSPRPQSGKSEFARILRFDHDYHVVKFADPIKDMLRGLLKSMGLRQAEVERMVEGNLKEQVIPGFETVTPRQLMQSLGTGWGREAVETEIWVNVARRKIERLLSIGDNVVVDDVRFLNELQLIKDLGGTTIRLVRNNARKAGENRHEGLLCNEYFDIQLLNDGDVEELWFKAHMVAGRMEQE